jgi:hypothetical protein
MYDCRLLLPAVGLKSGINLMSNGRKLELKVGSASVGDMYPIRRPSTQNDKWKNSILRRWR